MNKEQLEQVYGMVDAIPFSRVSKNISRDFADGVMMAELIYHYDPKIISLHNYPAANSKSRKMENWSRLNTKVLKKLGLFLSREQIENIVMCVPLAIEELLHQVLRIYEGTEEEVRLTENVMSMGKTKSKDEEKASFGGSRVENDQEEEVEEIQELVEKIDEANLYLSKLQEANKHKEDIIRNLQKKMEKLLFT